MDVQKYIRKVNIKRYFLSQATTTSLIETDGVRHSGLRNASLFNPPGFMPPSISVFKELVLKDLDKLKIRKYYKDTRFHEGLESLKQRSDIIIRPADKGGGIVVMDKSSYVSEMNRILSDTDTYIPLSHDPIFKYKKELTGLIEVGFRNKLLNKKEKDFLIPLAPRKPIIYFLPKVHKCLVNPPGRPIISGLDSITSRIGKYIDGFLQPLVSGTPSYIKDSAQVVRTFENLEWKEGYIMATADVASLYTIISHLDGLEAVEQFLNRDAELIPAQRDFILDLLRYAMTHNYFWFGGVHYLQNRGVAMGAKFAPSMANLFMAKWEEDGDMTSLTTFMHQLNDNPLGIVLQFESSTGKINFLDLTIQVKDGAFWGGVAGCWAE